jgi:hypothetical protein
VAPEQTRRTGDDANLFCHLLKLRVANDPVKQVRRPSAEVNAEHFFFPNIDFPAATFDGAGNVASARFAGHPAGEDLLNAAL